MQVCSYLCRAFREINISEHSVKWSSLNKSTWHNNTSGTWALFSPQYHLPLCVPVLPNGVSPQASKSNRSTQIQWEFIGNWFCLAKTLLIRWTEMITHFDPLSTKLFRYFDASKEDKTLTHRNGLLNCVSLLPAEHTVFTVSQPRQNVDVPQLVVFKLGAPA